MLRTEMIALIIPNHPKSFAIYSEYLFISGFKNFV